jgi:outer membrane protein assembly factor BamB
MQSAKVLMEDPTRLAEVESRYLMGPAAARSLGYSIAWQFPGAGADPSLISIHDKAVLTIDAQNFVTFIDRDSGDRAWRQNVASASERVLGLTYYPDLDRVYVLTETQVVTLDSDTGQPLMLNAGRMTQELEWVAASPPIAVGGLLCYGARSGQLVWQNQKMGFFWQAYQIGGAVNLAPVLSGNTLVAIASNGAIAAMNASTASRLWKTQLLSGITAPPAIGPDALFVAGLDQYLRCYDLQTGRTVWKILTDTPLVDGPTLLGDRLYQQIPGMGLLCLEATPLDQPGGVEHWTCKENNGVAVARHDHRVITWDDASKTLGTIDLASGRTIDSISLPTASLIVSGAQTNGDLFIVDDAGEVLRLTPRH